MVNPIEISAVAFALAFVFGLGGMGSAIALIPMLVFLGIPFAMARTAGLFVNFLTTLSINFHNIRKRLVRYKIAIPLTVSSVAMAPVGALMSFIAPEKIVGMAFVIFLIFVGTLVFLPKKRGVKEECHIAVPILIGMTSGFLSGLLGIGGGSVISSSLVVYGLNPKIVTTLTAFTVQFNSITSFLAYWKLGGVDWNVVISAAIPSMIAGYLASKITHTYLKPEVVRRILGILFYIIAFKFSLKFI